jgi:hypothetical protein
MYVCMWRCCDSLVDRVARRMPDAVREALVRRMEAGRFATGPVDPIIAGIAVEPGMDLSGAYQCLATNAPVFIHPSSVLFAPESQPDYLCYHELQITKKAYVKGVTAIKPEWLSRLGGHLCTRSAPLELPPPQYNAEKDQVICFVNVFFGVGATHCYLSSFFHHSVQS